MKPCDEWKALLTLLQGVVDIQVRKYDRLVALQESAPAGQVYATTQELDQAELDLVLAKVELSRARIAAPREVFND